jgi:hypothetical protein
MSSYGYLEIKNGKQLPIIGGDHNINQGKPLLSFLEVYLYTITRNEDSAELRWFKKLESMNDENIRTLTNIYYGDDLRYSPDEYTRFINDWGKIIGNISESEFRMRVEKIEKMWTPINEIITLVKILIRILPKMGDDTYWYVTKDTQPAFRALLNTLMKAKEIGGEKVRILFL